ncbi:LysR family transcriptional regulator [Pseudomonas sp. NA-150]|uniref:LysR family transcriptional regulator n=1 Tax=Pseudomonas sp. NA-150 TaxID=3367525 RepID=UPI0037C86CC7
MISIANISRLDLNLLVTFQCLMSERSVTRAAAVLHVTQGAVSSSLKRLREHFNDELFLRSSAGMVPTRRALELAPKVMEALTAVSAIVTRGPHFSVETSTRVFNIALSDDIESYLSARLVNEAKVRGLSVKFAFHQTNSLLWKAALADPDMDLVLCSEPKEFSSHYSSQVLFSSSYSCLYDGPRLNISSPITRDEYLLHDHVRVSFDGRRGFVDDLLEKEGIVRRVSASFTHFAGALATLVHGDVIATWPTFAALSFARIARLTVSPVPICVPAFRVFLIWEVERNADEQNQWLRNFIIDVTQALQHGSMTPP